MCRTVEKNRLDEYFSKFGPVDFLELERTEVRGSLQVSQPGLVERDLKTLSIWILK